MEHRASTTAACPRSAVAFCRVPEVCLGDGDVLNLSRSLFLCVCFFLKVSKYLQRFSLNEDMADTAPAEGTHLGTACCQLFNSSMRDEARRLRTFSQWPRSSPVSAWDLAKAGFFFVGPGDQVQCFSCGGILKDWEPGDCPIVEHLKFFPFCKFIYHGAVWNQQVPLQGVFDSVDGQFLSLLQRIDSEETALPNQPEYPEMVTEEMRLSTFQNWPQYTEMRPEQLARAGFFYTGQGDVVRCFYCDGGMRNWAFGDDPWREHAKWYPRCEFLLRSMGREFVSSVQESFASTPPPRDSRDQMGQGSSAYQDAVQGETETSSSRGGMQPVQQKEESPLSTEEQLRRLQEERMCKVCMDRDVSVVFVPCGHLVACGECALNLRLCPICRAVIRGSVRTFMS
ncbi:baculoviral IAP repeat-containing protein 7 isoform X3 [Meleagris gallopavo]|uniref:RING-type E3 ubiquitin transferase n=1 Tax=Meleagris gallopavo TaxID=9103 RepID=A0A803XTE3_MELGA|nr:baculoviral IAP repeat-containing protein 7 isoform X3 [Meleagris gallopavo]